MDSYRSFRASATTEWTTVSMWQFLQPNHPHLARLARALLSMTAGTASVERAIKTFAYVMTPERNAMQDETLRQHLWVRLRLLIVLLILI